MQTILSLEDIQRFDPGLRLSSSGQGRACCPLCGAGKPVDTAHQSLSVARQSGLWKCHRCGSGGRLGEYGNASAIDHDALALERRKRAAEKRLEARAYYDATPTALGTAGEKYLRGRGISREILRYSGIGFCSDFFGRPAVTFPLRAANHILVALQGRYIDYGTPKCRTLGNGSAGLFFTPGCLDRDDLVVAEAPIDALSLAMLGIPALASLGTSFPKCLPALARRQNKPVWLALDGDEAGDTAFIKWQNELRRCGITSHRYRPESGSDWNEMLLATL